MRADYVALWIFARLFVLRNPSNVCVSSESGHVPSTTAPAPMPSYCLTSNGHRYEEGDSWHDGCRDCYCHSGREMCVLISCPVPSCSHPVVKPDQCCPTCEGMSLQFYPVFTCYTHFQRIIACFSNLAIIPINNNTLLTKLIAEIWECGDIALDKLSGQPVKGAKQSSKFYRLTSWFELWPTIHAIV